MREIFILVPSLHPAGPVKGAIALANALAGRRNVTLVAVKAGPGADAVVDSSVRTLMLAKGRAANHHRLVAALETAGGRGRVTMISYCLSADYAALRARRHARWISSVRGNLMRNYRFDYGPLGVAVAAAHLSSLRLADRVVAMTRPMARQIARYAGRQPAIIGNFIDETALTPFRPTQRPDDPLPSDAPFTYVFVGGLNSRKQPFALLDALATLHNQGSRASLHMVGDGPLRTAVEDGLAKRGLAGAVTVHGHVAEPYAIVAGADALVLPSLSEGLSRAVLESLHLGVPAVVRDVDGVGELVCHGDNGILFSDDGDLPAAMLAAAGLRRRRRTIESLLPPDFRQSACTQKYLELAEAE